MTSATDHWEFDDDDFAQGLEFPDIDDKDYHSSNESLNASEKNTNKQSLPQKANKKGHKSKDTASDQQSNSADGSDFELLDKSEVDDMDPSFNNERPGSSGSLGSMGKWLGL